MPAFALFSVKKSFAFPFCFVQLLHYEYHVFCFFCYLIALPPSQPPSVLGGS
jgi:hypothetical protein